MDSIRRIFLLENSVKMEMAPSARSHCKPRSVSTLSRSVLKNETAVSSYLGGLSLCFLPRRKFLLPRRENGPGGIRTRICGLDRVLCSRYTPGPGRSRGLWRMRRQELSSNFCGQWTELEQNHRAAGD